MKKYLARFVVLLLVPCLIADPVAAATASDGTNPLSPMGESAGVRGDDLRALLQQQALAPSSLVTRPIENNLDPYNVVHHPIPPATPANSPWTASAVKSLQELIVEAPTVAEHARNPELSWRRLPDGKYRHAGWGEDVASDAKVLWQRGSLALIYAQDTNSSTLGRVRLILDGWSRALAVSDNGQWTTFDYGPGTQSGVARIGNHPRLVMAYLLFQARKEGMPLIDVFLAAFRINEFSKKECQLALTELDLERTQRIQDFEEDNFWAKNAADATMRVREPTFLPDDKSHLQEILDDMHHRIAWERLVVLFQDGRWGLLDGKHIFTYALPAALRPKVVATIHNHPLLVERDHSGPSRGDLRVHFDQFPRTTGFILVDHGGAYKIFPVQAPPPQQKATATIHLAKKSKGVTLECQSRQWVHDLTTDQWTVLEYVDEKHFQALRSAYGLHIFDDATIDWLKPLASAPEPRAQAAVRPLDHRRWFRLPKKRAGAEASGANGPDLPVDAMADLLSLIFSQDATEELSRARPELVHKMSEAIQAALRTLTPREEQVLRLSIIDKKKLQEIGGIFSVSKQQISQDRAKALRQFRHPSRVIKLWPIFDALWSPPAAQTAGGNPAIVRADILREFKHDFLNNVRIIKVTADILKEGPDVPEVVNRMATDILDRCDEVIALARKLGVHDFVEGNVAALNQIRRNVDRIRLAWDSMPSQSLSASGHDVVNIAYRKMPEAIERTQNLLSAADGNETESLFDLNSTLQPPAVGFRGSGPFVLHGIDMNCRWADNLPPVRGHPIALVSVFTNLLLNAQEALKGRSDPRRVDVATFWDKGRQRVGFRVADTGPGMSPEIVARLFEGITSKSDKSEEHGSGLRSVKRIVEAEGGTLEAQTEVGKGAVFSVYLPAAAPPPDSPAPPAMAPETPWGRRYFSLLIQSPALAEAWVTDYVPDIETRHFFESPVRSFVQGLVNLPGERIARAFVIALIESAVSAHGWVAMPGSSEPQEATREQIDFLRNTYTEWAKPLEAALVAYFSNEIAMAEFETRLVAALEHMTQAHREHNRNVLKGAVPGMPSAPYALAGQPGGLNRRDFVSAAIKGSLAWWVAGLLPLAAETLKDPAELKRKKNDEKSGIKVTEVKPELQTLQETVKNANAAYSEYLDTIHRERKSREESVVGLSVDVAPVVLDVLFAFRDYTAGTFSEAERKSLESLSLAADQLDQDVLRANLANSVVDVHNFKTSENVSADLQEARETAQMVRAAIPKNIATMPGVHFTHEHDSYSVNLYFADIDLKSGNCYFSQEYTREKMNVLGRRKWITSVIEYVVDAQGHHRAGESGAHKSQLHRRVGGGVPSPYPTVDRSRLCRAA